MSAANDFIGPPFIWNDPDLGTVWKQYPHGTEMFVPVLGDSVWFPRREPEVDYRHTCHQLRFLASAIITTASRLTLHTRKSESP